MVVAEPDSSSDSLSVDELFAMILAGLMTLSVATTTRTPQSIINDLTESTKDVQGAIVKAGLGPEIQALVAARL